MTYFPKGLITAIVTPFKRGAVDLRSFERLLSLQLDSEVDGVVINGTTGESPTLHFNEVKELFDTARAILSDKLPVIVGTGSNSTQDSIEMTKVAEQWGADAALVVVPYYNKPPQRGLIAHFESIANAAKIPIVLYNVPSRTVASLSLEAIVELARHPNIVALKEASGDLGFLERLKDRVPENFSLLSGDDGSAIEFCKKGGHGVISVLSNFMPREFREMILRAKDSGFDSIERFSRLKKLNDLLYVEANPIAVKAALYLMGLIESQELRLPLVQLKDEYILELKEEMAKEGLLQGD